MTGPAESGGRVLRVVHHHPGRLRVRATIFQDREDVANRVRDALMSVDGVSDVQHAPRTGSLLVAYDPRETDPNAILSVVLDVAELGDIVDEVNGVFTASHVRHELFTGTRAVDDVVLELTGGRVDLRALVAGALFAGSVYTFFAKPKDDRVPRWDNLLWWSYSVLSEDLPEPHRTRVG